MDTKDWLTIVATLLSPLIAVQVSVYLQHRKEKREQRFQVFRTLMATRAANLNPAHVEALNMIDVAYYGADRKSKAVVEACKVYIEHHNRPLSQEGWGMRREELLVDLLQKMANCLGYDFDKVSIQRTSYFPRGFGDTDWENQQIRKLALAVLKGERWLPVYATSPDYPASAQATSGDSSSPQVPEQAARYPTPPMPATERTR